jgi:hypothetical protein
VEFRKQKNEIWNGASKNRGVFLFLEEKKQRDGLISPVCVVVKPCHGPSTARKKRSGRFARDERLRNKGQSPLVYLVMHCKPKKLT